MIDIRKVLNKSRTYCDHILKSICNNLARIFFEIPEDPSDITNETNTNNEEMLRQLKNKFAETNDKDSRVKILSVLPMSWPVRKIQREFDTSRRLGDLTKMVVKENGILSGTKKREGTNILDRDTKNLVEAFYRSDDISRVSAGKRKCVSVNEDGIKETKQRRLILMNLSEAYALFKHIRIIQTKGVCLGFRQNRNACCMCLYISPEREIDL